MTAKCLSQGTGNSGQLPSQGTVDAGLKGATKVDAGKQGKHVPGHKNNVLTKTQWPEGQNGVELTQEAWMKGTLVKPDGSVKIYDYGKPVGPNGETRVKVHIKSSLTPNFRIGSVEFNNHLKKVREITGVMVLISAIAPYSVVKYVRYNL